jgi:hypothetical protein
VSRNCISLGCENWLITVNPLAASSKANVGGGPNARPLIALSNREIQLARLHVAEYNVARVFKGKRAIFELTHRLEAAS